MCDSNNNPKEKLKYNDKAFDRELEINKVVYVPGMFPTSQNFQSTNVELETNLLKAENTYKKKNSFSLDTDEENKKKHYRNFSLEGSKIRETLNSGDYIPSGYKGHGRGTGDQEIAKDLRYGHNSRDEKKIARETDLTNLDFNFMYNNFNADTVLPFARGGIDTRNLDKK